MTKQALLISNPGEKGAENYCKGVYVDVANFKEHLMSPEGGAWEETEITVLDRPSVAVVKLHVALLSVASYSFVVFTGHAAYSVADRDHILELRAGECLPSVELHRYAKKRTIILDCCQMVHQESLLEKIARLLAFSVEAERRFADRLVCKRVFAEAVQRCPDGIVKTTSCTRGEVSTDDETRGGRYSASLIECAEDWTRAQTKLPQGSPPSTFSIVSAHDCATEKTQRLSSNSQNPTIEKARSGPYFPFAVFG